MLGLPKRYNITITTQRITTAPLRTKRSFPTKPEFGMVWGVQQLQATEGGE